jgi:hypothetical protein
MMTVTALVAALVAKLTLREFTPVLSSRIKASALG